MKFSVNGIPNNPLKDIVLNHDELIEYALEMARVHTQIGIGKRKKSLLPRMKENMAYLKEAYTEITNYVQETRDLVPAAEWFLDNYYLLEDLRQEVQKSFPRKYERQLPRLVGGQYQGYPRVYALMVELVEHTDSQLKGETLKEFVNAYQSEVPLSSGELWAIPIMLRVVLLENIRRLVEHIIFTQNERLAADKWLQPFCHYAQTPEEWGQILNSLNRQVVFTTPFAERLLKRLRDLGVDGVPILNWLDKNASKQDTSIESLSKLERRRQASCQVSMGHAIVSLRFLLEEDWPRFFEEISVVETVLEKDPAGIFHQMDFASRDKYRHEVEKLARRFGIPELVVARKVLERAEKAAKSHGLPEAHVGYDLVGPGRATLERELEVEWGVIKKAFRRQRRILRRHPHVVYFGAILLAMVAILGFFYSYAVQEQPFSIGLAVGVFALVLIPASSLAIPLVNWLVSQLVPPTFFPKLELREGIPQDLKTMVVIPTLLTSTVRVNELLEELEVYYLANQDPNLHFALLGDFVDAKTKETPVDQEILRVAIDGINDLNQKYGENYFYLFHRTRLWNQSEGVWMGWERKRGKLIEFNRLLRQDGQTSYTVQVGESSILADIRYVITLDADTQLPRGIAKKLIGTLAHPLHTPKLSEDGMRVVQGYAILQPRVGISVQIAGASFFARIFSGKVGIDPYTSAVSDVYQDLFGEGIFTGKGIYNVEFFHKVTGNAFPENTILSHDLLEGLYARTGLITDIELIDGYPAKYLAFTRRLHRWVRGDWQILRWLFKPLPFISKWKIIDNMRRSLEAIAQVLLIFFALIVLPGNPRIWASLAIFGVFWPVFLSLLTYVFKHDHMKCDFWSDLKEGVIQAFLLLIFLPYHAYVMMDAIVRSLNRQLLAHRKMLEWETAAESERRIVLSLRNSWRVMSPAVLLVLLMGVVTFWLKPNRVLGLLPLEILWLISPWFAYRVSLPLEKREEKLLDYEQETLRLMALRIWAFFEEFVGPEDNWLPPDNVQLDPPNGVAHRTSPTNIGLAILANLAARDFGYLGLQMFYTRVENSLGTLKKLARWKGHFYNWYDTRNLKPLAPLYVSTVDSGNMALYMLTLKSSLAEILAKPVFGMQLVTGLKDSFNLLVKELPEGLPEELVRFAEGLRTIDQDESLEIKPWQELLTSWPDTLENNLPKEAAYWFTRLKRQILSLREDLDCLYSWLEVAEPTDEEVIAGIKGGLGLRELADAYRLSITNEQIPLRLREAFTHGLKNIEAIEQRSAAIETYLGAIIEDTDFRPLFDEQRQLFSIGYRVGDGILDKSYYDLLASEARQASFLAIAKGEVPQSHWFRLGRSLAKVKGRRALVSWSGTMFEFLMPLLLMKNYSGTLLDETYQSVVSVQQQYGVERKIPWGISESGYYAFDAQFNYQYKAFGVPGLGLKRGLLDDLVIAPYASFLALLVKPKEALANLKTLEGAGFGGRYGLYEAIDYTYERIPAGCKFRIVKSFMAHHQGMSFLALNNVLFNGVMQQRFHADASVQATELLLQERLPSTNTSLPQPKFRPVALQSKYPFHLEGNRFVSLFSVDTTIPVTHFISNGQYSVMVTNSGSGYSKFGNVAISRWKEDVTRDSWGMYLYIQNLNSGNTWSATYQPYRDYGEDYKVTYAPDRVEFYRKDGNITTRTEIVVSPEDQVEVRRVSLTNHSQYARTVEVTSCFEAVLAKPHDDASHPAFSNLFIQTEYTHHALLASRRPRREGEERIWLVHTVCTEATKVGTMQYETDRARFIGRGRNLVNPLAMEPNHPLSNTVGAVLDPIMSIRQRVQIAPGQTVRVSFVVGVADRREEVIRLAEKYRDSTSINRAFELAWTHSQMELTHLGLMPVQANEALTLGGHILYLSPFRREVADYLWQNQKGQSSLWPYAISGDLPIILVRVRENQHLELIRQLLTVHEYWRLKGLMVDLVILNEDESGYVQALQDTLRDLVSMGYARELVNRPGGVFLLQKSFMPPEDVRLLISAARLIFSGDAGSGFAQVRRKARALLEEAKTPQSNPPEKYEEPQEFVEDLDNSREPRKLLYANGYGGFTEDGTEYVIELREGISTPLPWINVIASPSFGCLVTEAGGGYTWALNSRENKLTPWSNDPVMDSPGEALYLRDEESRVIWSPTLSPVRSSGKYTVRHGQGYSVFEHRSHGLEQELLVFVPVDEPVKVMRLRLRNLSGIERHLTATYYVEWVMGVAREQAAPYVVTEFNPEMEAVFAQNVFQEEFAGKTGFLCGNGGKAMSYTGDRTGFIGRNGSLQSPKGLHKESLANVVGAGFDPCGAIQLEVKLLSGEEKEICFLLGETESIESAKAIIRSYKNPEIVNSALANVHSFWGTLLGTIQVETPDKSMDLLMNRWLLYQTIVCRLWARSALYQSGGAFGFRDQLQDVMALAITAPSYTREQIILHCAHQFKEGDVQHWWHAERGKGIRTKFSDDLLWLPFVVADYLEHTGDYTLLDENVQFLEDAPLGEDEDERYSIPKVAEETGDVYEHCCRAIERSLHFGEHGLPLMGSGDWNDGMNRVGREGLGESVWLGWFLLLTLNRFAETCEYRSEEMRAKRYRETAVELQQNIERFGWDGGWYRRAYFDDGTLLGSAGNSECQIDAIAQSWAVLSGGASPSRAQDAMLAMEHYLLRREDGILLLLTPPFDNFLPDPGYIKGYVPGVRENGGQYTHGAIWAILAFAKMGEGEKATELFHMLNPINHTATENEAARYKAEPYVMPADVYAIPPHIGRGGWTWYTGSSGWMYQAGLEGVLGFSLQGEKLTLNPCISKQWQSYRIIYRYKSAKYNIAVRNPHGKTNGIERIVLDGEVVAEGFVYLQDDGQTHEIEAIM